MTPPISVQGRVNKIVQSRKLYAISHMCSNWIKFHADLYEALEQYWTYPICPGPSSQLDESQGSQYPIPIAPFTNMD